MSEQQRTPAESPVKTLRDLLDKAKSQIALALPKHMTAERMIRVATTAFLKTPQLQECSAHSIVACVVQASELGLELTGPLGQAYMVPYWNKNSKCMEAQFQVGYRGFIDLAYRSGKVIRFSPRVVYANEKFKVYYGTDQKIIHEPITGDDDPGAMTGVYAVIATKDGGHDFEYMSRRQIDEHRKKYSKQKADGAFNPWNTAYEQMAMKTPIRRLAKRVPMSVELVTAAVVDEYGEAEALGAEATLAIAPPVGQFQLNGNGNKEPVKEPVPVNQSGQEDESTSDPFAAAARQAAGRESF